MLKSKAMRASVLFILALSILVMGKPYWLFDFILNELVMSNHIFSLPIETSFNLLITGNLHNHHNILIRMPKITLLLIFLLSSIAHSQIKTPPVSLNISSSFDTAFTTVLQKAKNCQFVRLRDIQDYGESLAESLTRFVPLFSEGVNSAIRQAFSNIFNITNFINSNITGSLTISSSNVTTTVISNVSSIIILNNTNNGTSVTISNSNVTSSVTSNVTNTITSNVTASFNNNITSSLIDSILGSISSIPNFTNSTNSTLGKSKDVNPPIATNDAQTYINLFNTHPNISDFDRPTSNTTGTTTGKNCTYEGRSYSHPTNVFLQIDRNNNIFPGSVLQGDKLNGILQGSNSPIIVPVSTSLKNPTIKIVDHLNVNLISVPYDTDSINKALSGAISSSLNLIKDNSIFFQIGTSDELSDFADRLNFNANLLKKLGLYRQPGAPLASVNKRIVLFFTKPIGTFEFLIESPNSKLPNIPLNTIFNSNFSMTDVIKNIPSWWGMGNPPVYIDSVTYGSMILLTVDYNSVTAPLYDIISTAANLGPSSLQTILTQIVSQPSLKTYSLGPFSNLDVSTLKAGNWIDFLFTIPSKPTTQMLQPLLYTTKDFTQLKYNAANTFEYSKICASPLPAPLKQYRLKLENILCYAPVILKIYTMEGLLMLNLNIFYSMNFNLAPFLLNNQMKVVIRPTVGSCTVKGCFKQSVNASFIIDTSLIPKLLINCETNCTESDSGTFIINKTAGSVLP